MQTDTPIYFISLGPGGADTVTLGTLQILEKCQCVYCFGSHGYSYAQETLPQLPIQVNLQLIDIPMSKDRQAVNQIYQNLAEQVQNQAEQGIIVALATEGDSSIYATTHYVKDMLDAKGYHTIQSAGIPSFIAGANRAGLHLISQEERLLVVPGQITVQEIEAHVGSGHALVIMKLSMAQQAVHQILEHHPEYQYHFLSKLGTTEEVYINQREELLSMQFPYFSLMIIKATAASAV